MKRLVVSVLLTVLLGTFLAACSGGGGSSSSDNVKLTGSVQVKGGTNQQSQ